MIAAIWIGVGLALLLWSLLGWGLFQLLTQPHQWLGDLQPLLDEVPFGAWLDHWLPGWQALVSLAVEAVQMALGVLGAAAPVVAWAVWGVGTLVLVGLGALASMIVALVRGPATPRRPAGPPG
ncbi:MAG: hypothetical protein ABIX12_06105 [Rubrivivax sp.]